MKIIYKFFLALALLMLFSGVAYAAGDDKPLEWLNLLWRIINFILVYGLLAYLIGDKIISYFRNRQIQIEDQLSGLETRRYEAEHRLEEVETAISKLAEEKKALMEEYKAQGEALRASIIAKAEESAVKIKEQAKVAIAQEQKLAQEALRQELAEMTVEAVEKILRKELDETKQEQLIDDYLTKVVLN